MKTSNKKVGINSFSNSDIEDPFLEIKDIKKGDVIYECDNNYYGTNYEFKALNNAEQQNDGWSCTVEDNKGKTFEIFVSGSTSGVYLPKFYRIPQYLEQEDGEFYYPVK